jgi:O-acetyl-ADP-ribose deacetylase (regulator of RNase III)
MVPECNDGGASQRMREDVGHTVRERRGSPVRAKSEVPPTAVASCCISAGVTGNPQAEILAQAVTLPTTPAGELMAK